MSNSKQPERRYAIVDIETTGGMPKRDRITEIGIVITDGSRILNQFNSLVNPERSIPPEITRITGITDDMVADAPKFYEIAKEVVLLTDGMVFVAHNVNFDYSFIQYEFDRLGFTYSRKQLCTVKLSRKTFPGLSSYSLGNLIRHFDIEVGARHRAMDDALATAKIFCMIAAKSYLDEASDALIRRGIKETKLPEAISMERIRQLPETTGVYYFYDAYGKVIYVGKSINIRSRVLQHFGQINAKSEKLMRLVNDLDFVETGSELIALLLESEEIKLLNPEINRAQKQKDYDYTICSSTDTDGYLNFSIQKETGKSIRGKILSYHSSMAAARSVLAHHREKYQLCEEKLSLPFETEKRCVYFALGECFGACRNMEEASAYNERAEMAAQQLTRVFEQDFILVTDGRNPEELGLVLVENKAYKGYGFIAKTEADLGVEEMKECIETRYSTPEANVIIQQFMRSGKSLKIVPI
ncbi:MAG: 3'-5' exoribonuclease [Saprospiraceae bacterium]|nr:3'-5' exoribonuclease [Saprospiraceae bacterium]